MSIIAAQSIKGYELLEQIGEGAHGAVYRAHQQFVNREVAVKIILPEYAGRPEFIRRFENEAQLVAQLEHLHILPLYDYWRDPDGAYLVMRLMKGGSLSDSLQSNGNLGPEHIARLVDQIASALDAAHQQGVVHRDLKPANILLDESRNAYLSDFGIAKELGSESDITQTSAILGTPAYISPEQVQGLQVSAQTDIYALGIMVYELVVGEHPFADTSTAELVVKHLNESIPYVRESKPELPAALDGVIQKATAKNPGDRYPSAQLLAEDFRQAMELDVDAVQEPVEDLYNPYKGLRAFQEYDSDDFFGREGLTGQLLAMLAAPGIAGNFLAVIGPSGSGKSSVVKAALLPALRGGALPGSDQWYIVEMHPGAQPLAELELALLSITADRDVQLSELIKQDRDGFGEAVKSALPGRESQLLLVIDQFEELYSLVEEEDQRSHFLESLFNAVSNPEARVRVVITLRADFYDRPLMHPEFGRLVEERTVVVLPLSTEELESVIRKPAERVGAVLEQGLVSAITADISDQPGALPLLQYALTELFERREGRMLSCEAYQSIGGVLGALGRRAEEVYVSLDDAGKTAARQLFMRLVTLGEGAEDTRRRVVGSEVTGILTETIPQVIDAFGKARLLTFDHDPDTREPTVEVAHEALLQEWNRLRSWLDNSRADIRMQRVLANAAIEWQKIDRNPGYLLRDTRLDQFEAWAETTEVALTELEMEFLDVSLAERRARLAEEEQRQAREAAMERRSRNFLRGLVAVLAIATIVAVGLTLFAFNQQGEAQNSAATAQAEAQARATQQMVAESEADQRGTQQAIAEDQADARATAEAIAVEERDKVLRQASVALAGQASEQKDLGYPERAVLLTLAAMEEYPYTPQAETALAQSVVGALGIPLYPGEGNLRWLAIAWSPTEERVATAIYGEYIDASILIQDPRTGSENISIPMGVECHDAFNVVWSPSGDRLIAIPQFCDYAPLILDADSGEVMVTLDSQPEQTNFAASWSPDGTALLTGSIDGMARIWDTVSGEKLREIPAHSNYITRVSWSPTGDQFATASNDDTAKIWLAETGELLFEYHGHSDDVSGVSWSPIGDQIATVSLDSSAVVLDRSTGEVVFSLEGHPDKVWDVSWSPAGNYIATHGRDGITRIWDSENGRYLFEFQHNLTGKLVLNSIDWSPNGDRILTMGVESNKVWDLSKNPPMLSGHSMGLTAAEWSPDGRLIATGSRDSTLRIWNASTGDLLSTTEHPVALEDVSWSPDSTKFATTSQDGIIRIWDAAGETFHELRDPQSLAFKQIAWSPDGNRIVASSEIEKVSLIFNFETGEMKVLDQGDLSCYLASPSWSPDGKRVVTGCIREGKNTPARIWDADTGSELQRIESVDGTSQFVEWSPDGSLIAVGYSDPIVRIWEIESLQPITRFTRHADRLVDLDFAPNSQRVVSIDTGRQLLVWDALAGSVVHSLRTASTPNTVAWSPDGKQVIATTVDPEPEIAQVWQSTGELITYAEQCCVSRELGPNERQRFGLP